MLASESVFFLWFLPWFCQKSKSRHILFWSRGIAYSGSSCVRFVPRQRTAPGRPVWQQDFGRRPEIPNQFIHAVFGKPGNCAARLRRQWPIECCRCRKPISGKRFVCGPILRSTAAQRTTGEASVIPWQQRLLVLGAARAIFYVHRSVSVSRKVRSFGGKNLKLR